MIGRFATIKDIYVSKWEFCGINYRPGAPSQDARIIECEGWVQGCPGRQWVLRVQEWGLRRFQGVCCTSILVTRRPLSSFVGSGPSNFAEINHSTQVILSGLWERASVPSGITITKQCHGQSQRRLQGDH